MICHLSITSFSSSLDLRLKLALSVNQVSVANNQHVKCTILWLLYKLTIEQFFSNQFSNMIKNIVLQARAKSWYFDLERNCSVEPVHIVDWNIRSARFAYTETCGFAETLCPICIREPDFDLHTTRNIHGASCPTYEWDSTNICANKYA